MSSSSTNLYYKSSILWLFLAPALGGFLFGYDIGGTSYVILELAALNPSLSVLSLRDAPLKTGWFVSAPSAGALLGTAVLVYLEQQCYGNHDNKHNNNINSKWLRPMGRQQELVCAGILYALGGCLQFVAGSLASHIPFCFHVVCLGRWIYGAGIGFAMHGGPTYLAETTPPSVRGMVVGAKEIAIVMGILCGYMVGNNMCTNQVLALEHDNNNDNNGWAMVYGLTVLVSLAMITVSKTIPESARYLVSANHAGFVGNQCASDKNKDARAEEIQSKAKEQISSQVLESLQFVWHPNRAREEHSKLMEIYSKQQQQQLGQDSSKSTSTSSLRALVSNPSIRPALKAGLGLVVLQQITGQPSVLSYATPILAKIPGLGSSASVLLASFKVLATSISVLLVERHGRKTLLIIGCSLMLLALTVLAMAFSVATDNKTTAATTAESSLDIDATSICALAGMFAYIAGYQIGFGPIAWLMISEVFPQSVRGTTVALAVQANFALNALVQLLVPILETSLGMSKTFGIFGLLTAYSLWFVQNSVPETKGLTLEEIEEKLAAMASASSTRTSTSTATHYTHKEEKMTTRRRTSQEIEEERIRLLP